MEGGEGSDRCHGDEGWLGWHGVRLNAASTRGKVSTWSEGTNWNTASADAADPGDDPWWDGTRLPIGLATDKAWYTGTEAAFKLYGNSITITDITVSWGVGLKAMRQVALYEITMTKNKHSKGSMWKLISQLLPRTTPAPLPQQLPNMTIDRVWDYELQVREQCRIKMWITGQQCACWREFLHVIDHRPGAPWLLKS